MPSSSLQAVAVSMAASYGRLHRRIGLCRYLCRCLFANLIASLPGLGLGCQEEDRNVCKVAVMLVLICGMIYQLRLSVKSDVGVLSFEQMMMMSGLWNNLAIKTSPRTLCKLLALILNVVPQMGWFAISLW
ncbi:hypothetical protein Q3G72_018916 [Acer saccharum]|nr:hypothetical protein Q3G72_018916 [Acer saccharum]